MRAITFIFACVLCSAVLVACQYERAEMREEPTAEPAAADTDEPDNAETTDDVVVADDEDDPAIVDDGDDQTTTDDEDDEATADAVDAQASAEGADDASEDAQEPTPEPETEATEDPDLEDSDWRDRGRLSILIAGADAAPDREGRRTDAMMVVSLDIHSGQTTIFGVPRNYGDIPLPEDIASIMGVDEYSGMLKWLYGDAQDYPELAPEGGDPGMVALKGALSELLGMPVDHYAMVDMAGFIELIDAFGGVNINVQEPVIVRLLSPIEGEGWQQFQIPPGEQTLDGREALAYSRHRTGTSDYDRMERQRCLVTAITRKADLQTLLLTFPDLIDVIQANIVTDVPLEALPEMIMLRDVVQMDQLISIGFNPPDYLAGRSSDGHNLPNYDAIQETVQDVLENPDQYLNGGVERGNIEEQHC